MPYENAKLADSMFLVLSAIHAGAAEEDSPSVSRLPPVMVGAPAVLDRGSTLSALVVPVVGLPAIGF